VPSSRQPRHWHRLGCPHGSPIEFADGSGSRLLSRPAKFPKSRVCMKVCV
jgi:hypothetical protein